MAIERKVPGEIRIFLNHVYEFKKGVRNMVLYTMNKEHEAFAIRRLERQNISYLIQEVNANKINLFFGKAECMDAIRHIIIRPLNHLTPEEDFIFGRHARIRHLPTVQTLLQQKREYKDCRLSCSLLFSTGNKVHRANTLMA